MFAEIENRLMHVGKLWGKSNIFRAGDLGISASVFLLPLLGWDGLEEVWPLSQQVQF